MCFSTIKRVFIPLFSFFSGFPLPVKHQKVLMKLSLDSGGIVSICELKTAEQCWNWSPAYRRAHTGRHRLAVREIQRGLQQRDTGEERASWVFPHPLPIMELWLQREERQISHVNELQSSDSQWQDWCSMGNLVNVTLEDLYHYKYYSYLGLVIWINLWAQVLNFYMIRFTSSY